MEADMSLLYIYNLKKPKLRDRLGSQSTYESLQYLIILTSELTVE